MWTVLCWLFESMRLGWKRQKGHRHGEFICQGGERILLWKCNCNRGFVLLLSLREFFCFVISAVSLHVSRSPSWSLTR